MSGESPFTVEVNGDTTTVRILDAHAWVEVFFPGYGWIPFDPTGQVGIQSRFTEGKPVPRATIGPVTARGATWLARVAGPFVAETHWRLNISAITGTFQVAGWIAVDR